MKKMYKIFGAISIIGLFLLGSIASTSMARDQPQMPEVKEGEGELLIPSEPPEEPQGFIFGSDLEATDIYEFGTRVKVEVTNHGLGFCFGKYQIKVHVAGIVNPDDIIEARGPWFPHTSRTFTTRAFTASLLGRTASIKVDYKDDIWEGIGGNSNNVKYMIL